MKENLKEGLKMVMLAVCLIVIAGAVTFLVYNYYAVEKIIGYDAYLIVSDKIGFDVSKDYIHFGMVKPGGSASKHITLLNAGDKTYKIQTKVYGDLEGMVTFGLDDRYIQPGENKTIDFSIKVPQSMPYGNYTGRIEFIFRKF